MALLEIEDLATHFFTDEGVLPAVDGVSLEIHQGQTVGLVGESGCGKSVTAMSVLRLLPEPPGRIVRGAIRFRGEDLLSLSSARLRRIRGKSIAMIFQEPMTSLNPVYTVGEQLLEAIELHRPWSPADARVHAIEMLQAVGLPEPAIAMGAYPHQLSGGMRQRVMIAVALSCEPDVLIADEPTTALDVTVQAQILDLLEQVQVERQMGMLLITHDLGIVAEVCQRVVVMYAGRVVEEGSVEDIFERSLHPYTMGLLRSLPNRASPGSRLPTIAGSVPSPLEFPSGCRFRDRCERASSACTASPPEVVGRAGQRAWCFHPSGDV